MTVIATICARGGSVGLPGKNIKDFNGKPLIAYTIEQALACNFIDDVIVSTDDLEIAEIARQYGANVPFIRPSHLATAEIGKLPVIEHCIQFLESSGEKISTIIDLQPTSPLRKIEDIKNCLDLLTSDIDCIFSVCKTDQNPYYTLLEIDDIGVPKLCKKPSTEILSRQKCPEVYVINGSIYAWHRNSVSKGIWGGKSKCYVMPKERSVDIDDVIDFKLASLLAKL